MRVSLGHEPTHAHVRWDAVDHPCGWWCSARTTTASSVAVHELEVEKRCDYLVLDALANPFPSGYLHSSMKQLRIGLIGDYHAAVTAHRAIDECFACASEASSSRLEPVWLATDKITAGEASTLESFHGIWLVPASPYRNTGGALWTVEYARMGRVPFLGTCGGFQHAVLEYVRNALGLREADHSENCPDTTFPLLSQMECSLVEKSQSIRLANGSQLAKIYGVRIATEAFHCSYGFNPRYEYLLRNSDLQIAARSEDGQIRAVELRGHPFFLATLFQPERRALSGSLHPLVLAFFGACACAGRSS
jgi:CTP synthase (UTP-ammonia lyase)